MEFVFWAIGTLVFLETCQLRGSILGKGRGTGISLNPAVEDACLAGCEDMTGDDDVAERFGRKRTNGSGVRGWWL